MVSEVTSATCILAEPLSLRSCANVPRLPWRFRWCLSSQLLSACTTSWLADAHRYLQRVPSTRICCMLAFCTKRIDRMAGAHTGGT